MTAPPIGVGRVEFYRLANRLERVTRETGQEVRSAIGWSLFVIGLYVALAGWALTKHRVRP